VEQLVRNNKKAFVGDDCANGLHQFVVSRWSLSSIAQTASGWSCQRCLLVVEGKDQIDIFRAKIHERHERKIEETEREIARSTRRKSASGEKASSKGQS